MVGTPLIQSRPAGGAGTPFTCSDLGLCSIADLGFRAHDLLAGLDADDHPQYALLAGRAGGQVLSGGLASPDTLTLRPYPAATVGIQLAAALPNVTLMGNVRISDTLGVGTDPNPYNLIIAAATIAAGIMGAAGANIAIATDHAYGNRLVYGLSGGATGAATGTGTNTVYGLFFGVAHASTNTCNVLAGAYLYLGSSALGTGALTIARCLHLPPAVWSGSKPATVVALDIYQQGGAGTGTAYGHRLADQTATTVRLLELGPVTPYLRLRGGADPAANESNLDLKLGSTLKQITEYDVDTAGAGYRALRVPN